jgi:hypothetical protein
MSNQISSDIYQEIIAELDIPDAAYDKAAERYKDVGEWFGRPESECCKFKPHIYSQGSFRLGTVIRPLGEDDEYDLDLGCRLRQGVSKTTHTQKELKAMVGRDLEAYRVARKIENLLDEKHRCWRLKYKDEIKFHMDTVPSIPEEAQRARTLMEEMIKTGSARVLAEDVTRYAGAITDNRLPNYSTKSPDWRISNSEGYARWFESRIKLEMSLLEKRAAAAKVARVDELPAWRWKSPLQQAVQILKRHRDVMYTKNPDNKPASIIITTLAGRAYRGSVDTYDALSQILSDMGNHVNQTAPRVPNPVHPSEDFADKWSDPKYRDLNLEQNFWLWLKQARTDLQNIGAARNPDSIIKEAKAKLGIGLRAESLNVKLGSGGGLLKAAAVPSGLSFPSKPIIPSKPAGFA